MFYTFCPYSDYHESLISTRPSPFKERFINLPLWSTRLDDPFYNNERHIPYILSRCVGERPFSTDDERTTWYLRLTIPILGVLPRTFCGVSSRTLSPLRPLLQINLHRFVKTLTQETKGSPTFPRNGNLNVMWSSSGPWGTSLQMLGPCQNKRLRKQSQTLNCKTVPDQ